MKNTKWNRHGINMEQTCNTKRADMEPTWNTKWNRNENTKENRNEIHN